VHYLAEGTMVQTGAPLVGSYDYGEVARSILIAIAASYAALDLGGRVTAARGWARAAWLTGGGIAMGIGIWAMHFKGMLAFHLPVKVDYHWPTVLASLLIGVLSSAIALYTATRQKMGPIQAWTGSLIMGGGIAGLHYVAMAAMRMAAVARFDPLVVALSVVLAIMFSRMALLFTFEYREDFRGTTLAKLISAAGMGAAISLMHYTGMAAASFIPAAMLLNPSHTVSVSPLGSYGISIVTLLVLGTVTLTSSVDRRLAAQAQELQTSERFRQIADNLQIVLSLSSADFSTHLYVNRTYEKIWGRTVESLYADPNSWLEAIHPDDRGRVNDFLQRLTRGEAVDDLGYRIVRPDGSTRWIAGRGYPIFDSQGHLYRIVGSASDITKRKHAEERLREYEKAVEGLEEMIVVVDREYRYLLANRAFLKYRNLERETLLGRLVPDFLDREVFDRIIKPKLDESFQGKIVHYELRYKYPHLGERDLNVSYFPIEGPHGVDRVACVLQDVTERKRADAAIRQEQEQAQRYLDVAEVILLALDLKGRISMINRKGCATLGWEERELLGRAWIDTCLPVRIRDKLSASFHNLLGGDLSYIENPILTKSGEERLIGWRNTLLRDEEGRITGTLSSGEDITERKQAEEGLRRLSGKLLRLQDEERRKIARDLHDSTGQDLVALATMQGQLGCSMASAERKSRRLLDECKALADKCIREVRTLSYLLHPPILDQAGLEDAIREYVGGFSERSGIQVELELPPNLGRMARDIELAVFRVVQESLTNSQRHSGSQQAKIRIDLNSELTLEISDQGHGTSAVEPREGEEPRFKAGVGISSMRERVQLIGGSFEIESTSHGTIVRVTIPLRKNEREKPSHTDS
jgi:PAS domain S-box-containing protein